MTRNFDINKHGRVTFEVNEVPSDEQKICDVCGKPTDKLYRTIFGKWGCGDCVPVIKTSPIIALPTQPTDLELRIRKEVMDNLNDLIVRASNSNYVENRIIGLARNIEDRLKLLWGSND